MSVSFRNFKSAKNLLSECSEDCQCRVLQFNGREGERKKEAETRERERERARMTPTQKTLTCMCKYACTSMSMYVVNTLIKHAHVCNACMLPQEGTSVRPGHVHQLGRRSCTDSTEIDMPFSEVQKSKALSPSMAHSLCALPTSMSTAGLGPLLLCTAEGCCLLLPMLDTDFLAAPPTDR